MATIDGEVVGFVGVCASRDPVDPQLGELETIAVDPVHWRRRVGRALMAHAENQLRQRWAQAILWTPAGYARGHAFYLAMGWRPLSQERRAGTEVAFGRTL